MSARKAANRTDVPDVGDYFTVTDRLGTHDYRVISWLKPSRAFTVTPDGVASLPGRDWGDLAPEAIKILEQVTAQFPPRGVGEPNMPLSFCHREEAIFIGGAGVGGTIQRVRDVVVKGQVPWSEELLADARQHAELLAGERLS